MIPLLVSIAVASTLSIAFSNSSFLGYIASLLDKPLLQCFRLLFRSPKERKKIKKDRSNTFKDKFKSVKVKKKEKEVKKKEKEIKEKTKEKDKEIKEKNKDKDRDKEKEEKKEKEKKKKHKRSYSSGAVLVHTQPPTPPGNFLFALFGEEEIY